MTHLTVWTCNVCGDTACEIVSEDPNAVPRECPMHQTAKWVEGAQ